MTRSYRGKRRRYPRRRKFIARRRYPRRRRQFRGTAVLRPTFKNGSSMPERVMVKLKYSAVAQNTGTGTQQVVYRGNSIHDPYFTGSGSSVQDNAAYYQFYGRCLVHASKITVTFINRSSISGDVVIAGIYPVNSASAPTAKASASEMIETSKMKTRQVTPWAPREQKIQYMMKSKYILNNKDLKDNFGASHIMASGGAAQIPEDEWLWVVETVGIETLISQQVDLLINITYYCELFERKVQ